MTSTNGSMPYPYFADNPPSIKPHPERISTLINLLSWAIATGRLQLIARAWLTVEREVHGAA